MLCDSRVTSRPAAGTSFTQPVREREMCSAEDTPFNADFDSIGQMVNAIFGVLISEGVVLAG